MCTIEPKRTCAWLFPRRCWCCFSFGGMTGPALDSALMTLVGPSGLFLFNAIACTLLALTARRALGLSLKATGARVPS